MICVWINLISKLFPIIATGQVGPSPPAETDIAYAD